MKCPNCGQWNQAAFPRCFKCGVPLPDPANTVVPDAEKWQDKLREAEPSETYIQFEEQANVRLVPTKEIEQEILGREIESLKERRSRGEFQLANLRQQARQAKEAIANAAIIRPAEEKDPYEAYMGARTIEDLDDNARVPERKFSQPAQEHSPRRGKVRRSRSSGRGKAHVILNDPQIDWRGQTAAAWKAQEEFIYTDDESAPVLYDGYIPSPKDRAFGARGMDPDPMIAEREKATWTASRHPAVSTTFDKGKRQTDLQRPVRKRNPRRRRRNVMLVQWLAILGGALLVVAAVALGMNQLLTMLSPGNGKADNTTQATIVESVLNGHPAHTIWIPGKETTQIYIQELQKSYVVTGGSAEIQVEDYIWYDDKETIPEDSMEVSLTPTVKYTSGEQKILPPIRYTVNIPLSDVRLIRPESMYARVSTSIFDLRLQVERGSRVVIDGTDVTDQIDANGRVGKNVRVQDIGENRIQVSVRSKYRRPNNFEIVLYREAQEIMLTMAGDTLSETEGIADEEFLPDTEKKAAYDELTKQKKTAVKKPQMKLFAEAERDATIVVETPHRDLDLSTLPTEGRFSFIAELPIVGDNEIRIRASKPGKKDSVLTHIIYYVPPVDVYTRKAWSFERSDYVDLINNINNTNTNRKGQVYECKGTIKEIISQRPQLAIMDTRTPNSQQEQLVLLENNSKTTWEVGRYYRVYSDAFGLYGTMPWLITRFTYTD